MTPFLPPEVRRNGKAGRDPARPANAPSGPPGHLPLRGRNGKTSQTGEGDTARPEKAASGPSGRKRGEASTSR